MKIAFCTYVEDRYFHSMGGYKLMKSAQYFHPEIPMIVYGDEEIKEFGYNFGHLHALAINKALQDFDAVIYMDSDSIIVGKLDTLIAAIKKGAWDVIGVRNNNDYDRAGKDNPIGQNGAGTEHYWNAGLVATGSRPFIREWIEANLLYGDMLPFQEQSTLNAIIRKYDHLMIDPKDSEVYYGVSALSGEETHWDSWKDIKVVNGGLKLNEKTIKVLHHGGGKKEDKLGFYMFNDETRKRLIEITGL